MTLQISAGAITAFAVGAGPQYSQYGGKPKARLIEKNTSRLINGESKPQTLFLRNI